MRAFLHIGGESSREGPHIGEKLNTEKPQPKPKTRALVCVSPPLREQ